MSLLSPIDSARWYVRLTDLRTRKHALNSEHASPIDTVFTREFLVVSLHVGFQGGIVCIGRSAIIIHWKFKKLVFRNKFRF